jgi:hypothetical protein
VSASSIDVECDRDCDKEDLSFDFLFFRMSKQMPTQAAKGIRRAGMTHHLEEVLEGERELTDETPVVDSELEDVVEEVAEESTTALFAAVVEATLLPSRARKSLRERNRASAGWIITGTRGKKTHAGLKFEGTM